MMGFMQGGVIGGGASVPFSTNLWTGNGTGQTINTGIDASTVVIRGRTLQGADHIVYSKPFGANTHLRTNTTSGLSAFPDSLNGFTPSGYVLGSAGQVNGVSRPYVGWSFKNKEKFFTRLSYVGNSQVRSIQHSLSGEVGCILLKLDATSEWIIWHRKLNGGVNAAQYYMHFNDRGQIGGTTIWDSTLPTSSVFTVGNTALSNTFNGAYNAFLFGHDASSRGVIVCDDFTTDSQGQATVNIGWKPQFIIVKQTTDSSGIRDWIVLDSKRVNGNLQGGTFLNNGVTEQLRDYITFTNTGFKVNSSGGWSENTHHIFIAIREGVAG